jgi:hypothetical protein
MLDRSAARCYIVSFISEMNQLTYKPYCVSKTYGTPPNERYRIPRIRALHISRKSTINCVVRRTRD